MKPFENISGPESACVGDCERVLRSLPEYFGIEEALVQYVDDIRTRPTFHAWSDSKLVGFLSVTRHAPRSAEIHVMAIVPEALRRGIGTALVEAAERYLIEDGVVLFEVKTLGERHPDEHYKRTRAFYRAQGFIPLEEVPDFWGKGLPTLFMVKPLVNTTERPNLPR